MLLQPYSIEQGIVLTRTLLCLHSHRKTTVADGQESAAEALDKNEEHTKNVSVAYMQHATAKIFLAKQGAALPVLGLSSTWDEKVKTMRDNHESLWAQFQAIKDAGEGVLAESTFERLQSMAVSSIIVHGRRAGYISVGSGVVL